MGVLYLYLYLSLLLPTSELLLTSSSRSSDNVLLHCVINGLLGLISPVGVSVVGLAGDELDVDRPAALMPCCLLPVRNTPAGFFNQRLYSTRRVHNDVINAVFEL